MLRACDHELFADKHVTVADVAAAADAKRPEIERVIGSTIVMNERGEAVNESKITIIHVYVNPVFREASVPRPSFDIIQGSGPQSIPSDVPTQKKMWEGVTRLR
jgi:hypothetical protein